MTKGNLNQRVSILKDVTLPESGRKSMIHDKESEVLDHFHIHEGHCVLLNTALVPCAVLLLKWLMKLNVSIPNSAYHNSMLTGE